MSGQALATAGRFIGAAVDGNALYNSADMAFQTLLYLEPGAGGQFKVTPEEMRLYKANSKGKEAYQKELLDQKYKKYLEENPTPKDLPQQFDQRRVLQMKSFVGKNIPKGKFNYEKIPNFDEALEKIEIQQKPKTNVPAFEENKIYQQKKTPVNKNKNMEIDQYYQREGGYYSDNLQTPQQQVYKNLDLTFETPKFNEDLEYVESEIKDQREFKNKMRQKYLRSIDNKDPIEQQQLYKKEYVKALDGEDELLQLYRNMQKKVYKKDAKAVAETPYKYSAEQQSKAINNNLQSQAYDDFFNLKKIRQFEEALRSESKMTELYKQAAEELQKKVPGLKQKLLGYTGSGIVTLLLVKIIKSLVEGTISDDVGQLLVDLGNLMVDNKGKIDEETLKEIKDLQNQLQNLLNLKQKQEAETQKAASQAQQEQQQQQPTSQTNGATGNKLRQLEMQNNYYQGQNSLQLPFQSQMIQGNASSTTGQAFNMQQMKNELKQNFSKYVPETSANAAGRILGKIGSSFAPSLGSGMQRKLGYDIGRQSGVLSNNGRWQNGWFNGGLQLGASQLPDPRQKQMQSQKLNEKGGDFKMRQIQQDDSQKYNNNAPMQQNQLFQSPSSIMGGLSNNNYQKQLGNDNNNNALSMPSITAPMSTDQQQQSTPGFNNSFSFGGGGYNNNNNNSSLQTQQREEMMKQNFSNLTSAATTNNKGKKRKAENQLPNPNPSKKKLLDGQFGQFTQNSGNKKLKTGITQSVLPQNTNKNNSMDIEKRII